MVDLRQTLRYKNYLENLGWKVVRFKNTNYAIKRFFFIGSFLKIQRPKKIDFNQIEKFARKYRVFQIVIEPLNADYQKSVIKNGYKRSKNPFVPSKTIYIDLTKSKKVLLKEMHYKTRYNIKIAIRNKVKVITSGKIKRFADFWQKCARDQRGMFLSQIKEIKEIYKAFQKSSSILLAYHNEKLIGGILLIGSEGIIYYMYAASSKTGKKLFAPTLLVWKALLFAKKNRYKIFDFEGIYDERFPLKSWKGFTRFKKSFGGKVIEHPGAFTKFRLPV